MKINADFSERVVLMTEAMDWIASPMAGVERRMLDRIGDEVARATSLVRYAPESYFSPHTHGGGEEFLVLEGVFCDEHGDYGPGTYVRNPPGTKHKPSSPQGCTILVKLWQMDPDDQEQIVIDSTTAKWRETSHEGITVLPLFERGEEVVQLIRFAAGATYPRHAHPGGEEILILDGALQDELGRYPKGGWIRNPPGSEHEPFSPEGCTLYIKTGHLPPTQELPG